MKGILKKFSTKGGYGFIIGDDERKYFVHYNDIINPLEIHIDSKIEFNRFLHEKGLQARKVRRIE